MTKRGRAHWNARYAAGHDLWSRGPHPAVTALVPGLPIPLDGARRAVDLGAGEGRHAVWLANQGWQVEAVDFAEEAVQRGQAYSRAAGAEVAWHVAAAEEWQPLAPVDLLLLCYFHLEPDAFRRSLTWLRPSGHVLVISHADDPTADSTDDGADGGIPRRGPRNRRFRHSPQSLRGMATGLDIHFCDHWPPAGVGTSRAAGSAMAGSRSDVVLFARVQAVPVEGSGPRR